MWAPGAPSGWGSLRVIVAHTSELFNRGARKLAYLPTYLMLASQSLQFGSSEPIYNPPLATGWDLMGIQRLYQPYLFISLLSFIFLLPQFLCIFILTLFVHAFKRLLESLCWYKLGTNKYKTRLCSWKGQIWDCQAAAWSLALPKGFLSGLPGLHSEVLTARGTTESLHVHQACSESPENCR